MRIWVLLLSSVLALPVFADDAKSHYEKGVTAYALGHFTEAADEYEKAFVLKRDSALLYNAAQAHRLAGNKERALVLYQNYLNVFPNEVVNRDSVIRRIAELKETIEKERALRTAPPTEAVTPGTKPAPVLAPPEQPPPPVVIAQPPPPPPRKSRAWIGGVVAGGVVVLGVALGVGLGIGLSGTTSPVATFGSVTPR